MPQANSKSSSGQKQQQTAQTFQNHSPYTQFYEDDTIDLFELWIIFWKRKWLVIALTVVAALGSIVYALQLKRIYKAEALLLPPKEKDIQSMNVLDLQNIFISESGVKVQTRLRSQDVFPMFTKNLFSRTLHKKFIQKYGLMEILAPDRTAETRDEDIYKGFAKMIKLDQDGGITSLSIELHDPEIAAQWVNDLTEFIDKETIYMLLDDVRNKIANKSRDIEFTISSKRQMAKQRREDMILRYEEAAIIAKKLGVMDRVDSTNIVQNNQLNITTTNVPLYFRGFRALSAEILFLKNRVSDDPFIAGLRDLQEQLALLRSIKLSHETMKTVFIDQAAYPPKFAIKPNRRLIVAIATVVGLFSGIFLIFFIEFVQYQRKKHSE